MEPHFHVPPPTGSRPALPDLPIVTPDSPRPSQAEKYGSLFYVGIAGLAVLVGLIGYFAWGLWSLRAVWTNIYVLHSRTRPETERVNAAYALARDPRVTQRQYWEICLRKPLPPLARYLMAEAITADTVAADPRAYAWAVARSEGWPDWLRVQLARPLAYAAGRGVAVPRAPLLELSGSSDTAVALLADFTLAAGPEGDAVAASRLNSAAAGQGPYRPFAHDLRNALMAPSDRTRWLDAATLWLRHHHPGCALVWSGWEAKGRHIARVRATAPNLQPGS